jgi:hypothetical protein
VIKRLVFTTEAYDSETAHVKGFSMLMDISPKSTVPMLVCSQVENPA